MAINRRQFLRTSLAGSAVILGSKLDGMNRMGSQPGGINIFDEQNPPAKGKSLLGLRCNPIPKVRIGVVGLGRGGGAVNRLSRIEGTEIVALCDLNPERIKSSQKTLQNNKRKEAAIYTGDEDWKRMCERDDIDLIYNATPWDLHVPIALYAMDHGKHVAIEIPAALTVKDCWALVDKAEEKQVGGHGGMDFIMDWRLICCLQKGYPLDQSVYDAASWSSLVELTERSVLNKSCSVAIPDFTRGAWRDYESWPVIDMDKVLHG